MGLFPAVTVAGAADTSVVTVQVLGGGTVSPNLNGQFLTNGAVYTLNAKPRSGYGFLGWSGSLTYAKTKLTFTHEPGLSFTATFADQQKPTVKMHAVSSKAVTRSLTLSGTAKDNDSVTGVFCRLNGGDWQSASTTNAWSNWWHSVILAPGANTLEAYATDPAGLASKTNKLKLTYDVTPSSLAGYRLRAVKPDSTEVAFDFGDKTFTETAGVGTYDYNDEGPAEGRLTVTYAAPPSATNGGVGTTVFLQFFSPTNGIFTDADGTNTFTLSPGGETAPAVLADATVILNYAGDLHRTVLGFAASPTVVEPKNNNLANPLIVPLDGPYPGQVGDRVSVTFLHSINLSYNLYYDTWRKFPPMDFAGSVVGIGNNQVSVLFDNPPDASHKEHFFLKKKEPLKILSCSYQAYFRDQLVTQALPTFVYTNTSPNGALLHLNLSGQNKFVVLSFTNVTGAGTFYQEDYYSTNAPVVSEGTFIWAPPE